MFGKKQAPVDRRRVLDLVNHGMRWTQEMDRDTDDRAADRAKGAYDTARRKATPAELKAAHAALRRHGY